MNLGDMWQQQHDSINSPISKLPTETLSAIFELASPPPFSLSSVWIEWSWLDPKDKNPYLPVVFGAVSTYWRKVAWSTPSLWTSLCLKLSPRPEKTFEFEATILSLHLSNSTNNPIRLALYLPCDMPLRIEHSELIHRSVHPLLLAKRSMIQTLVLINPLATWLRHLSGFSALRELGIDILHPIPSPLTPNLHLSECHSLHRLSLHRIETTSRGMFLYKVPPSITILDLSGLPIDSCIRLVLQVPHVVELYLRQPSEARTFLSVSWEWFKQQVLEDLEFLYWEDFGRSQDWRDAFLAHIHMPNLRRLQIVDRYAYLDASGYVDFFQQLPSTLSTLELDNLLGLPGTCYIHLFNSNSPVQNLILVDCALHAVLEVLSKLNGEPECMSQLQCLSINGSLGKVLVEDGEAEEFYHLELILLMMQRWLRRGDEFRLEFSGLVVNWAPEIQAGFKDLVRYGIKPAIVEDSEPVDWLFD